MVRVRWNRSQGGFTESKERRFILSARHGGSTTPDWYVLEDRVTGRKCSAETQKECKEAAEEIILNEERPVADRTKIETAFRSGG